MVDKVVAVSHVEIDHKVAAGDDIEIIDSAPEAGFSKSIIISGIRCAITYVIVPFVTPFIGLAPGVGPVIGLVVGAIAMAANLWSIRRFWRANHKYKKPVTVLHVAVLGLLSVLMYLDITALL